MSPDPSATLAAARLGAPRRYERLIDAVEWKLIEMPLPRLQVMGGVHDAFIYRIGWDTSVRQADTRAPGFDPRVHFVGRAAEYLTQLGGLLRPLIETKWVERVLRINRSVVADAGLPEFMFGAERISLAAVRPLLCEAQSGRCFYCGGVEVLTTGVVGSWRRRRIWRVGCGASTGARAPEPCSARPARSSAGTRTRRGR